MTTTTSTDPYATDTSTTQAAGEEGRRVAGVAKDELGNVAAEAKDQVAQLLDETRSQLSEQGSVQRDRLVSTLTTLGDDLEHMAAQSDRPGMATDLARQVAGRARDLSHRLDGREPSQILDDVRSFARRRPGTFLLGALAAGVIAGRLTRGAKESQSSGSEHRSQQSTGLTGSEPLYGAHAAGTTAPATPGTSYAGGTGITDAPAVPGDPIIGSDAPAVTEGGSYDRGLPDDRGAL